MARKLPPLLLLLVETVSLRDLLINRLTIIVAVLLLASAGATAYVSANDDGEFTGRVVTESGEPVENVTVTLREIPLQGVVDRENTRTNADGEFRFTDQTQLLEYRVDVRVDGEIVAFERNHLFFRGQNRHVVIVVPDSAVEG